MNASQRNLARRLAVLVLGAASASAFAQAADPGRAKQMGAELKQRFAAADSNHDGLLTRDEAKAGMPFVYRNFEAIDTAKNGKLSMAEIATFIRAKAAERKSGG